MENIIKLLFLVGFITIAMKSVKRGKENQEWKGQREVHTAKRQHTPQQSVPPWQGIPRQNMPQQSVQQSVPQQGMPQPIAQPAVLSETEESQGNIEMSTTDYLEQKAREDEIQHEQEKRVEEWRNSSAAQELNEGDSIPSGMMGVVCAYCGADNMVPVNRSRKYTCYFCREEL